MPIATATLQHQLDVYVAAGYPSLAGLSESQFTALAQPVIDAHSGADALLVVTRDLIDPEARVPLLRLEGSQLPGVLDRNHASDARAGLSHYAPREGVTVPAGPFYVVVDVDRGDEFRNVAPRDALPVIASRGRTPLTIDEGLSLATVLPEVLVKNHCFMLAGSTRGDKRVPALWIADKAPKLGWCFDGVPHSWLGVASAGSRLPADA
jgi:hypothetical protein